MLFKNKKINISVDLVKSWQKGFTIMELMVVIFISSVILTALVVKQNSWNDQLTVSTQAYELALMIRQAQVYSLGVREDKSNPNPGDKFGIGYGVYFDYSNLGRYIFFADRDRDQKYDSGEEIEIKNFNRGVLIDKICGVKTTGQQEERCSPNGGGNGNVVQLGVSFYRPDTKANIVFLNNGGNLSNNVTYPGKIYLKSIGGKQSLITVESNGRVSIDDL